MDFLAEHETIRTAAIMVGIIYLAWVSLSVLCDAISFIRAFILAPCGIGRTNLLQYGSWAVVTGASEGIGRGYALELARRGLNVVLMSRSKEKLDKVAQEIKEKYGRQTKVIPVDFSDGQNIYSRLSNELLGLDVGTLINNVGLGISYPDILTNISEERQYNIVMVNCHPVVQMSKILLPQMIQRGGGVIVNLSSGASLSVTPQSMVYSSTKVFINYISHGLHKEYASKGIIVQNVKPFFVATAMSGMEKSNLFVADSISYARAAIATIGIQRDTYGCTSHAIQGYITTMMPEWLKDRVVNNASNNLRAKWHYKMAKKNKN